MKYTKLPISIEEQIAKLKSRGLLFSDENKAAHYLSNISYYRLRAYTYPFQDNENLNHLCCILYILNIISPEHSFKNNLLNLMKTCPMMQEKEMGFPKNWQGEKLWQ